MMRYFLIIAFSALCSYLQSQQSSLNTEVSKILDAETFNYASVGLSVREMNGKEVLDIGSNKKLIPASSQKLITTLSALDILGEDYTFSTKIGYAGDIDKAGTLNGDLVIIGSGDPTFASSRFHNKLELVLSKILQEVNSKGIKCIDGKISIRTNVFDGQNTPNSWPFGDIANYYGSGAWALNFNENEYSLHFKAKTNEEKIAKISKITPDIPFLSIESTVVTKGPKTGDNAYIYGDENNYHKIVRGTIPYSKKEFIIKGAIPNPPYSFGALLSTKLENHGILTNGIEINSKPIKKKDFEHLHSFTSPTLFEIIKEANYHSLNMYCEALLRIIGKKQSKKGSIEAGLQALEDKMTSSAIDKHSFHLEDGSGLSPRNGITTSSFTRYLIFMFHKIGLQKSLELIPQVGVSGTVRNLLHQKASQKKFYLKSGSMGGVLSYTGFFMGKSKKWYSISFISNNHSHGNRAIKAKAELIFEKLYQSL